MKFSLATTLTLATLSLATPAPRAGPLVLETIPEFRHALLSRAAASNLDARAALVNRASSKPKGSSSGGSSNSSAAVSVSPSNALVVGALGVGVMEVIRLWN